MSHPALSNQSISSEVERTLATWAIDGEQIVVLVPDRTRTCPLATIFPMVWSALRSRASEVVVVIALGTHEPLDMADARAHLGLTAADDDPRLRIVNHVWRDESQLVEVGRFSESDVVAISEGRLSVEVPITILRTVAAASHVLVLGPVFPHEVAGFSGGNKYLFPGVAGRPIIDFFHWLGALITNRGIIGVANTPVREVLDRASAMVTADKRALCMVVGSTDGALLGLFGGEIRAAWSAAVNLSRQVHIRWCERPFHTVVSVCPPMYPDLWTGGKCMYKLEPVIADGGELIILAPHIREVSRVHGHILERVGYHVRDYFVAQWEAFRNEPWGVLAHSTHVRGDGSYVDGIERPRIRVTLASGIDAATCRRIGLEYRDPTTVDPESFADREAEGVLLVRKAGEVLHRLH